MMSIYKYTIEHRVCGIPCRVGVIDDEDCLIYDILVKGKWAKWLERKMKPEDDAEVWQLVHEYWSE